MGSATRHDTVALATARKARDRPAHTAPAPKITSATTTMTATTTAMALATPPPPAAGASDRKPATARRARLGRAMTNAERGRAFRERRAKYAGELEVEIYRLRAHVAELEGVRDLWRNTRLHAARASDTGSLVRLIHEYMTLFRFGFRFPVAPAHDARPVRPSLVSPEVVQAKISYQEHFLRRVMAHDARVGESVGPEASISNWNGYTLAHGNQRIDVHRVSAIGSDDHLVTEARVTFNGKITETTFRVLYPRALHRHDLLAVFLNRDVQFNAVFRHEFTTDGQIQHEGVEIAFVEGLLGTGAPLSDVMELLRLSIMSPVDTIAERIQEVDPEIILRPESRDPGSPPRAPETLDGATTTSSTGSVSEDDHKSDKLRMEYILGE